MAPTRRCLPRRAVLAAAGAVALDGCARWSRAASLARNLPVVSLSLYVIGGEAGASLAGLGDAVQAAVRGLGAPAAVSIQNGGDQTPLSWFPLSASLYDIRSTLYRDDPTIPMPDIVVGRHALLPDRLAIRALDLGPYMGLDQGALRGVAGILPREGRAFSADRGSIQAGLPVLRVPALAIVADGLRAVYGGRPWTLAEFGGTLEEAARKLSPPSAPFPWVPVELLAGPAAVGSGGSLTQLTAGGCAPVFGQKPAVDGLAAVAGWTRRTWFGPTRDMTWSIWMGDGLHFLKFGGPSLGQMAGSWAAWRAAPLPTFTAHAAVPTNNVDVTVFRHTAHPREAATVALGLLSTRAQEVLGRFHGGLPLRAGPATDRLRGYLGRVEGADVLGDPSGDVTDAEVYGGTEDPRNASALGACVGALNTALRALCGGRGGFQGGRSPSSVPTDAQIRAALAAAESRAIASAGASG